MKATINGLTYNTATASLIASAYSPGYNSSDFNHWSEDLYRTQKGAFFLAGSGGPMSKYAEPAGQHSTSGGSRITPLTETEALAWCEQHELEEAIEEYLSHLTKEA